MENDNVEKTDPSVLDDSSDLPPTDLDSSPPPAAHVTVTAVLDPDTLVNGATGTQLKEAFQLVGINLDSFCPPGASNPGVYNGVQLVDAFKAWDKINPGKIDMNTISTNMTGTQVVDAFKIMIP